MANDRPVYILPLQVNIYVYWPIIGNLYCMTSFFIRHYFLLRPSNVPAFFRKIIQEVGSRDLMQKDSHFILVFTGKNLSCSEDTL